MDSLNENLLNAWLRLSTSINNPRIVSEMTYNESLVCNILYNHSESEITATDLCNATKMLKSQMNRTLNQLEKKNLITKERSSTDKRQIYIYMNIEQAKSYEIQHQQVLNIINLIINKLGKEKAQDAVELFRTISNIADNLNLNK